MSIKPNLGIQLYSVRDLTGDEAFPDTLRALADMGFQGVEFAWQYGGMAPEDLAAFLQSLDLACCGLHVQLDELLDPSHVVYDYAKACESPFITTSLASRIDDWAELTPRVDQAGAVARSKGLQFTYHNHWQEFVKIDGMYALDVLCERTNPDIVHFELDLGWVRKGGEDPMTYWRKLAGRVPQIHLRDYDAQKGEVCDLGAGFIDVPAIAALAGEMGTQWLIYEQDRYPLSPLESAKICAERCREAGLMEVRQPLPKSVT